jgi:hypothetical protein
MMLKRFQQKLQNGVFYILNFIKYSWIETLKHLMELYGLIGNIIYVDIEPL